MRAWLRTARDWSAEQWWWWWATGGPNPRVAAHTGETCGLCPTTGRDIRTRAKTRARTGARAWTRDLQVLDAKETSPDLVKADYCLIECDP